MHTLLYTVNVYLIICSYTCLNLVVAHSAVYAFIIQSLICAVQLFGEEGVTNIYQVWPPILGLKQIRI